jgi:hypothetical protein
MIHLEEDEEEYDAREKGLERQFPKIILCVAHSIQLPLRKVIEGSTALRSVQKKVNKFIKQFNKSHNCNRELVALCGKKLLQPAPTRWMSSYITNNRLLEILPHVQQVNSQ